MPRSVAFTDIHKNYILLSPKSSKVNMYAKDAIISFTPNSICTMQNTGNEDLTLLKTRLGE